MGRNGPDPEFHMLILGRVGLGQSEWVGSKKLDARPTMW